MKILRYVTLRLILLYTRLFSIRMDLTKIKSAVLNQLTNTNGLYSLKLQNHIYGCFIVMEDIAQSVVDLSGTVLYQHQSIHLIWINSFMILVFATDFAMDSKLALDTFNPEYKETWLQYFRDIDLAKDIEESDKIEDAIIEIVQKNTKPEEAFLYSSFRVWFLTTRMD